MKNFFQRRPDTQPNAPAKDAYKVWLPPPDAPRASTPTGPTTWVSASGQSGARSGGETHRSSSRAPRADAYSVPTSSTYKYATLPNNAGFYSNPAPTLPSQPFPPQYYPSSLPRPPPGYIPSYPYPNPQQPQSFAAAPAPSQPVASKGREDRTRYASDGRGANTVPAMGRPSSSRQHSEKDDGSRAPRQPSSSKREEVEMKKPKHRTREPSEPRKRRDSQAGDSYAEKYRDKSSRKESRRDGKFRPDLRVEEGDSSDSSIRRPPSSAGHRSRRMEEGKPSMVYFLCCGSFCLAVHNIIDEQT
ncbi:hypothetical protein C8R44DRAFT_802177 [Mycena epipterygia]|nr:hypothetical protein C8R44DRAFT_802177 [Mycena epipterygia]